MSTNSTATGITGEERGDSRMRGQDPSGGIVSIATWHDASSNEVSGGEKEVLGAVNRRTRV